MPRVTAAPFLTTNRERTSTMADITLEQLRAELAPIKAQLDSIPMQNRALTVLQQDMRALRAAFNDFAKSNPTSGEIEALHFDVNRVQADNVDLIHRLTTLERLAREHGWE
jgi:Tfp pilus assembly protein PilO